ncbi:regulatory protein RecX [Dysgonomonas sp. 25]|uniref:regulatory protein RecX n=1 Tax=Dysgonomonas sp. 25 TaxID=2302933 RepID=UPI0013D5413D|nr:regulatory protein RecX [Dysgonomonas sp. 25]NDV70223.1 RecX family transcriptional regulator [Dysgonomonas sp. 25]
MDKDKNRQKNTSPSGRKGGASEPRALNRIASYCSRAERCEYDVLKKLKAWELTDEEIARIMKRLRDEKYVNNARFARSFINDKLRFNKWGKQKIVFELRKRQILESVYRPLLDEVEDDTFNEQLESILRTKLKSVKAKDNYDKRNKLIRFALGRGFSMDAAIKAVNKLLGSHDDEDFY